MINTIIYTLDLLAQKFIEFTGWDTKSSLNKEGSKNDNLGISF